MGVMLSVISNLSGIDIASLIFPSTLSLLGTMTSAILFTIIGIILHELGHLVFGLLTGYRFSSFRLASLVWFKEDNRICFKVSSSVVAGQCLMVPTKDFAAFKFILYNLGGAIFNFLLCLVLLVPLFIIPWDSALSDFFRYGLLINFMLGAVNLIPIKSLANDGANLFEALKSESATRGLYMMLYINNEVMEGKRFRDFDSALFEVAENADLNNYMIAYLIMLEASRLEDLGQYDEFAQLFTLLDPNKLPSIYGSLIKADLLYYHVIYNPNYDQARQIYKDKKLLNLLKAKLPTLMRISAAYEFFVKDDKKKGTILLEKAKKSVINLPNKGQRLMETEYIKKLEDLMQANQKKQEEGGNHAT